MAFPKIITTIGTAVIVTVISLIGTIPWLAKRLINTRLKKNLKDYQADLDTKLATAQAELNTGVEA